jgi:ClpP class serine protease
VSHATSRSGPQRAAYWIGSSAEKLYVTPSGDVGSVGVYVIHWDETGFLEQVGEKPTIIRAGKYKIEANPFEPLSDEAKEYIQADVNETYAKFVKALARNRGTNAADVKANYGQGRVLSAKNALAAGMVDGVLTLEQLLTKITGGGKSGGRTRAEAGPSVEVLRRRQEERTRKVVA